MHVHIGFVHILITTFEVLLALALINWTMMTLAEKGYDFAASYCNLYGLDY